MNISEILNELIREDGRYACEIAEAANVSPQLLSTYRRNQRTMPWAKLEKVLGVLGYELEVVKND